MKYCVPCGKEHLTIYDYCSDCGHKLLHVWPFKCLECGHGANASAKFCCCCGSNLMIANKEIETEKDWIRE